MNRLVNLNIEKKSFVFKIIALLVIAAIVILTGIFVRGNSDEGRYFATIVSLIPPLIAIGLALFTKEVYFSLFIGIVVGALYISEFRPVATLSTIVNDGIVASIADSWNVGILVFLVVLGIIVILINKAGGTLAFGLWAKKHIKTKIGAELATFLLGVMIFVDDYFNCLTVGSIMRPICDQNKVSREKLAYLIDSTAAPICMIAPISSWAAAVSSTASKIGMNGITLFIKAIPFNYYSLLTIVTIITLSILRIEFGPMKKYNEAKEIINEVEEDSVNNSNAKTFDLIIPILILIVFCILGIMYSGNFFNAETDNYLSILKAFEDCDAAIGLSMGSVLALIIIMCYFIFRGLITFKDTMNSIPDGFKSMVPAILILCFAWTLNTMTSNLGAADFVYEKMSASSNALQSFLPAIIFLVACALSFATGTSWGTFGILIPIIIAVFGSKESTILTIGISACLAGAVCGDHCSPISDTTIMASAGAKCNHLNHVSSQLPYALTVACVSFVSFILAGLIKIWYLNLLIAIVLMVGTLLIIKLIQKRKENEI